MAEPLLWRKSCVKSACKSTDGFGRNATRLQRLVYRDTEEFRSELNVILEELNVLDYSNHGQSEEVSYRTVLLDCSIAYCIANIS